MKTGRCNTEIKILIKEDKIIGIDKIIRQNT